MLKFITSTLYGTLLGFSLMVITVAVVDAHNPGFTSYALVAFFFGFAMPFVRWADKAWKVKTLKEEARLEAELNRIRNS